MATELIQMNIHQSNNNRKDLHFHNESRFQQRQPVEDQQSSLLVLVAYLIFLSSSWEHQPRYDIIPCKVLWLFYRDIEQPQEKETSQNKPRVQFLSNIDSVKEPQPHLEGKGNPSILKDDFSL